VEREKGKREKMGVDKGMMTPERGGRGAGGK